MPDTAGAEVAARQKAQERLIKNVYDWLYYAATDWTLTDAEDVVQEALTRALEKWALVGPMSLEQQRAWVKRVAFRTIVDRYRRADVSERHDARVVRFLAPDQPLGPHEAVADNAAARSRSALFSGLSKNERALLAVWAEQNVRALSVVDAARVLGMSEGEYVAARKRLARTLRHRAETLDLDLNDLTGDPGFALLDSCVDDTDDGRNDDEEA